MTSQPAYAILIFAGRAKPEAVKSVGPFDSADDAQVWATENDIPLAADDREWGVIVPQETPEDY